MRKKVIEIYQSGKGYKAISKALGLPRTTVRAIIYKWRKHGTVENLPRSGRPTKITPRVHRQLIQEVTKDPTTTSKELQASLASVKVSVHDSTIRKRLGKNGLHGRVPRRKLLLSKKNIKARLSFARKHLDDPQDFRENTLWTDETKIEHFGRRPGGRVARSIGAGFNLFYYGVDSKRNGLDVVLKEEFVRNVLEVGCELEEKERFWIELDEVMESIPTGERVVIGADFNGHVGEGNTGDEEVMGKFGVKERNLEGQMVVDFAKRMDMAVVNTYFQKREEHRVTYKSGGKSTQVVLPDDWETTAEVIRETGRKVLGVSSRRRKENKETWWWNEEVQDSIQRMRLAKKKWDMDRTEENRQEYKELQRRVKREVSKAKHKAYDELYTRLDTREGEKDLYRLARQRDRDGKDVQQYRDGQRELHCLFVDLEKAYDRVSREELWYCMRKSGVTEKYDRVVQDMYERSRTVVRCAVGQTEEFKVEVGLHQGSALSPFLFAMVMDQLSEEVRQESPWTMMFADDIVICSESREQVEENLERWRFALERRGMKVSRSKTEYMCVNEREGSGTVRLQGEEVNKVQEFKYLGSTVQSNGECGKEGAGGNWATVGRRSRGGRRVHRQREKRKGKGRELGNMRERRKVDILCVQETRWKGSKARSIGAGFKLFYYGVDSKRNGLGVVLKEEFVRNVLEVGCELEEKERFWIELDEVMESIPTGERVVIGADFNGHVGEGNTGDEEVMGKFGVKERNLEGQMVVDFAKRMDMAVVNTYEEHRVTYKSGGNSTQVVLPDDWETTAEVIRETGRKVLGVSSGRRKEDKETWWWNEEVQDSIKRMRLAKKKWDMDRTEENRQEYKKLQRRVKREVSKARQKAYDELYTRLDTREGEKDLYRLARQRDRDGKDVQQVRVIKDRDGRVLTSEESVQRRWKEYFEELMNEENEREKRVEGVNSVEQKVD
ncbi:hypothetical protein QTP86_012553 [Hemibagrus guttatus]|nr:hypothetical protein QTP86_012553 [Hemibagrus guttatus]